MPQALIDTIGQTRTFVIKISQHNLDGKTQALTVTKVLSPEVPAPSVPDVANGFLVLFFFILIKAVLCFFLLLDFVIAAFEPWCF